MKRFLSLIFLLNAFFLLACSQQQSTPGLPTVEQVKKLKLQEVYQAFSPVSCQKIVECYAKENKEEILQTCEKDMQKTLERLIKSAGNVEMEVDSSGLEKCLKSIQESSCEELDKGMAPKSCEFLEAKLAT